MSMLASQLVLGQCAPGGSLPSAETEACKERLEGSNVMS